MYFDELISAEKIENKIKQNTDLFPEGNAFLQDTDETEHAKAFMHNNLLKYNRLGLIKKTEKVGIYDRGDESIISVIYAKCITSQLMKREKYLKRINELIEHFITYEDICHYKNEVIQIGFVAEEYVLLCNTTALIHKAFHNQDIMKEVLDIFKLLFKNVYNDFKYQFNLERLSYLELMKTYIDKTDPEKIACVFFAHRYAKELTVHVWAFINLGITMLIPPKATNDVYASDSKLQDAYTKFVLNAGGIICQPEMNRRNDSKIAALIKEYNISDASIFIEGCYYIKGFQTALMKYLDKELLDSEQNDSSKDSISDITLNEKTLQIEKNKLQNQVQSLEEKCNRLQKIINEMSVQKEIAYNKLHKDYISLKEKYNECKIELEMFQQLEPDIEEVPESQLELRDKKIMIIGGHDRWHQIIKSAYPDWILVNDEKPIPVELKKMDGIFLFTKYMSHSLYRKYVNQCRTHNIPFYYLTSVNIHAVEEQIKQCISKTCN